MARATERGPDSEPVTGLVLAGGGARGAYELGLVRYLRGPLARELGFQPRLDILSGTSVGAINACALAGLADAPERQGDVAELWSQLDIREILQLTPRRLLQLPRWLLGRGAGQGEHQGGGLSLLHTAPLERLVTRSVRWGKIRRNLQGGHLRALSVTATRIDDGCVEVFVDSAAPGPIDLSASARTQARHTRIGPRHALASAAIPLLFSAVPLEGRLYLDGGLRQNTPLLPALALGATRVLIVGMRFRRPPGGGDAAPPPPRAQAPSPAFLMGKVLDTLLLDQVVHDLERLRRLNALIDEAEARWGPAFVEQLGALHSPLFNTPFRRVRELALEPSEDLGRLAARHLEDAIAQLGPIEARLLAAISSREGPEGDEDLASYLLFHGPFARDLIALGEADARRAHQALLDFFAPAPGAEPSVARGR